MDGAVPQVYIGLILGVFISFCLSIRQLWLAWKGDGSDVIRNEKQVLSKRNLICSGALLFITIYVSGTIIGQGPLIHVVLVQFLMVLLVYIKIRMKEI